MLRDRYGNSYNRIAPAAKDEVEIKAGETITETLVFEPTAFGSEVTLDLPVPGGGKGFEFLIPAGFIDRGAPPAALAANQIPNPAAPPGLSPLAPKAPAAQLTPSPRIRKMTRSSLQRSAAISRSRWPRSTGAGSGCRATTA